MDEAVSLALARNPELSAQRESVKAAMRAAKEKLSPFFPSLAVGFEFSRTKGLRLEDRSSWYVSFYYAIFNGGMDFYSYLAEKTALSGEIQRFLEKGLDVALEAKLYYLDCLKKRALIGARRKVLESAEYHYRLAEARYRLGLSTRSDLMKAEVDLEKAKVELERARIGFEKAKNALERVLGGVKFEKLEEVERSFEGFRLEDLIRRAMERPGVRFRELEVDRFKYLKKVAEGEYLPKVSLQGEYGWVDKGFTTGPGEKNYYLGLKMELPLFTGFSTYNRVREMEKKVKEAVFALKAYRDKVEEEVKNRFLDYRLSIKVYKLKEKRLEKAEEDLRIQEGRYREGLSPFIELRDAQASYEEAVVDRINAYYDIFSKIALLKRSAAWELKKVVESLGW